MAVGMSRGDQRYPKGIRTSGMAVVDVLDCQYVSSGSYIDAPRCIPDILSHIRQLEYV